MYRSYSVDVRALFDCRTTKENCKINIPETRLLRRVTTTMYDLFGPGTTERPCGVLAIISDYRP